ncbi:hypothetical protein LX81_02481 [Palleronia aestuarii]|uniref:CPBP family intramembrane metalloprotease n=1 Tax=Palleronia aestuarii TaxID=568105 RepID=A0A2W7N716_9RHOB|nr:hypothetical protein [Palleronia aestuarii]PZX15848.1 hypothetical protein LX81_02481 [Palleronia aestuarii]
MIIGILVGVAAAVLFIFVLSLADLLRDRGAAAMSIVVVASVQPVFAIASGTPSFPLHLAIFGVFVAVAIAGYLFAPRLIAYAVMAHAALGLSFILKLGEATPPWLWFDFSFDVVLGLTFLKIIDTRT